jgi:hypothetical protein
MSKSNLTRTASTTALHNHLKELADRIDKALDDPSSTISDLDLAEKKLGDEGLKFIVESVKKNKTLRTMDLSQNHLTKEVSYIRIEYQQSYFTKLNHQIGCQDDR